MKEFLLHQTLHRLLFVFSACMPLCMLDTGNGLFERVIKLQFVFFSRNM